MWQELTRLWQGLRDPEYLHLLLEPLPLYGLAAGLLGLMVAQLAGESKSRLLALLVITASCASVWPYQELRRQATPRILATRDPALGPLIRAQTERRERCNWAYYAMAGLGAATLAARLAGKGKILQGLTLAGAAALLCLSIWLHQKECEVYHRNIFKNRAPGLSAEGKAQGAERRSKREFACKAPSALCPLPDRPANSRAYA